MATRIQSYRQQIRFWLDKHRQDERELLHYVDELKQQRRFTKTIRDALRLVRDLQQGKTDVLRELFPWVFEDKKPSLTAEEFERTLQQFERRLANSIEIKATPPKQIDAPHARKIRAPIGAELEITKAKSNENAAYNLQISGLSIGTVKLHELGKAVLEYGLKHKKFSAQQAKEAQKILDNKAKPKGPKAMNVPQFEPPAFDDLSLEF